MGKHFEVKPKKNIITTIMFIFFSISLLISTVEIMKWYNNNKKNKRIQEEISQAITINEDSEENTSKYNVNFEKLKEKNSQVIGWLKVNNTKVEYAVVQAKDNNYYLKRNLEKQYNVGGWIFADYRNKLDGTDKNIIIYGHNMKDNSMFGSLENILTEEWYNNEENRYITFITENEQATYQVFSIYKIKEEQYYLTTNFSGNEFEKYLETVSSRSINNFNADLNNVESILTLSTCADNNQYRIVLHAFKIE